VVLSRVARRPAASVLLLALAACGDNSAHAERRTAPARGSDSGGRGVTSASTAPQRTTVVDTATVLVPLVLPAQLYVERDAIVAARAPGTIDTVVTDVGAQVAAGALLATVESIDQRLALSSAEAAYDNAERFARRARSLSRIHGVSPADSEQAEFQLRQAEIARDKARRALDLTRVVAPFAGVVSGRWARPHRLVGAGDTLFRVTESGPLLARVHVPEVSAVGIHPGLAATVVGSGPSHAPAVVLRVAPAIDAGSGTREVTLQVESRGLLLPGSSVSVRLGTQPVFGIAIPREAVGADGYVLVVQGDRTVLRPVTVGADLGGDRVAVTSGLSRGERVVVAPVATDR
jgi:RND family efflux transporter MFP subunit